MLDPTPLLQITLLELRALLPFQTQTGVAQRGVHFPLNLRAIHLLPLAHERPLFGSHLHPTFGVTPERLSIFRRHRHVPIAQIRRAMLLRWRHSAPVTAGLSVGETGDKKRNRECRGKLY